MHTISRLTAGAGMLIMILSAGCSSSDGDLAAGTNLSADNRRTQLAAQLPGESELTRQVVDDGVVTQEEQELAIAALFECYSEHGLTPSSPEWGGVFYTWTVDTGTLDPELGASRSESMFQCERLHWDFVFSYVSTVQDPTAADSTNLDALVAECVTAKGLDGAGYLAGDPAVLGTAEAATCYQEVQQEIALGDS